MAHKASKELTFITLAESPASQVKMPVAFINGRNPGPTLCVTAGVHGCEYSSIEAVIRLIEQLKPEEINGKVIAIPIVNIPSFEYRSAFVNPLDNLNLNRIFPGNPKGTISHIMVNKLYTEIIAKSDFFIDCHGGDLTEDILNCVWIPVAKDEKKRKILSDLAACFNTKYVLLDTEGEGSSTYTAFIQLGIPSLTTEGGGAGLLEEEDVRFHLEGIINVMKYLEMLDGTPNMMKEQMISEVHSIKAPCGGIFRTKVKLGDVVESGQTVAEIIDVFGKVVSDVKTEKSGTVLYMTTKYGLNKGDTLMWIATPSSIKE